jgi:ribokinase
MGRGVIYNLGSINLDHVYRVPHLPLPGETLGASGYSVGLGGKGANQSVAAARAGARVCHIGAVGPDGDWARRTLADFGVDVTGVQVLATPTGHAIINVDTAGENAIVLFPGANVVLDEDAVAAALAGAGPGDTLMLQNETSGQEAAARLAAARGLRVIYSAAPFDVAAVRAVLPYVSLLAVNAVEAAQLTAALGRAPDLDMIVTRGAQGAEWFSPESEPLFVPSFPVTPVDTTGAGDCFIGTLAAALDAGDDRLTALRRASAAAAIQVTRPGASTAMPTAQEVTAFLA